MIGFKRVEGKLCTSHLAELVVIAPKFGLLVDLFMSEMESCSTTVSGGIPVILFPSFVGGTVPCMVPPNLEGTSSYAKSSADLLYRPFILQRLIVPQYLGTWENIDSTYVSDIQPRFLQEH